MSTTNQEKNCVIVPAAWLEGLLKIAKSELHNNDVKLTRLEGYISTVEDILKKERVGSL